MRIQFMKPFAVRLDWLDADHAGQGAVWVAGENQGKMRAKAGGLLGLLTVSLDPVGSRAMKGNHHPSPPQASAQPMSCLGFAKAKPRAAWCGSRCRTTSRGRATANIIEPPSTRPTTLARLSGVDRATGLWSTSRSTMLKGDCMSITSTATCAERGSERQVFRL